MSRSLVACVALLAACGQPTPDDSQSSESSISPIGRIPSLLPQPSVSWTKIGTAGLKIAACSEGDGRVYGLFDPPKLRGIGLQRMLEVIHPGTANASWTFVATAPSADQIFCADNTIWRFDTDRTLWRNDGSDTAVQWTYVGKPFGAKRVTGTTSLALFVPYPVLYALNDDNTLWKSLSGADGSWTRVGDPWAADRIAAGGGLMEARPFALNTDKTFWLNNGDGCDPYWMHIDTLHDTLEITAASEFTLYALNSDHSLWKGVVNNSKDLTTVRSDGKAMHCDGSTLVTNHCGDYDESCCNGGCNSTPEAGLYCNNALCESCGGNLEAPCPNNVCNTGLLPYQTYDGHVYCSPCGQVNGPCCQHPETHSVSCNFPGWSCTAGGAWMMGSCRDLPPPPNQPPPPPPPSCPPKDADYSKCCNGQCIGNRFCNSQGNCQPNWGPPAGGGGGSCSVIARAHVTTCSNWDGSSPSSLSHTLCADGCGASEAEAEHKAEDALRLQTCLGGQPGCCNYTVDHDFNQCGE